MALTIESLIPYGLLLSILLVFLSRARIAGSVRDFARYWHARNIAKGPTSFVHALHTRKGQKIVRVGRNEFSITDPALVKTIYHDRAFLKSDQYAAFDVAGQCSLFSMRDPIEHTRRSKAVRCVFSSSRVRQNRSMIEENATRTLDTLQVRVTGGQGTDQAVNVLTLMRGFAVQTISRYALGKSYLPQKDVFEVGSSFGQVLDDINVSSAFGRSTAWPVRLYDHIVSIFSAHQAPSSNSELETAYRQYISFCTETVQASDNSAEYAALLADLGLPSEAIETEVADLLFAGTDSTATTLATALWHIYSCPAVLARLRSSSSQESDKEGDDGYLSAVINESLRLATPVPRRLPRVVPRNQDIFYEEDKHDDAWCKILPAGSIVGVAAYALHRDVEAFPDAHLFRPERWLSPGRSDGQEGSETSRRDRMRDCFMPFGKGVRACIGQELARAEIELMIRLFVERFDAEVVLPTKEIEYHDHFNARIAGSEVVMSITPRI